MNQFSDDLYCSTFSKLKSLGVKVPKIKKFKSSIPKQERSGLTSDCKIFGVSLSEQDKISVSDLLLPKFIVYSTSYLKKFRKKEIGLFRKAGSISRQRELRVKLENGESIEDSEPNDVASLLKQWLRELPEPLIPVYLHDLFLRCQNIEDEENKMAALLLCCHLLPPDHLYTLKHLMDFLYDIASNCDKNKMGTHNLAVIMAPNIFVMGTNTIDKSSNSLVQLHTSLVELLISNAAKIREIQPCTSVHLTENESLKYSTDLDISLDALDSSPSKSKKKRRSGPVQELFSGIRKLVGQTSTSPNPLRKMNPDDNWSILTSVSKSASKRKADPEELSMSAIKRQAVENCVLQIESQNFTPTGKSGTFGTIQEKRSAHSRRKSFGFLRKKEKKRQKASNITETKVDSIDAPSSFQVKLSPSFQEPSEAQVECSGKLSPLLSESDIDKILSRPLFVKKSISDNHLTVPDEEFKDLAFHMSSSCGCLQQRQNKVPPYNLRSNSETKRAVKQKSDILNNEIVCFSPKDETKHNSSQKSSPLFQDKSIKTDALINQKAFKRNSLSSRNKTKATDKTSVISKWNSGSPILKDCYVDLSSKVQVSKFNFTVPQTETLICGNINSVSDKLKASPNQSICSSVFTDYYTESLNNSLAFSRNSTEDSGADLDRKDANRVSEKLDVPPQQSSSPRSLLTTEVVSRDCCTKALNTNQVSSRRSSSQRKKNSQSLKQTSSVSAKSVKAVNKIHSFKAPIKDINDNAPKVSTAESKLVCTSLLNFQEKEEKVTRTCSIKRQEAFRIKAKGNKKKSLCEVKSADPVMFSTKKNSSVKPQIDQNPGSNNRRKEYDRLNSNDTKSKDCLTPDKIHSKWNVRKGSIVRGRPNTVKTGLPFEACNRFNNESNTRKVLSSTSSVNNDLFISAINHAEANKADYISVVQKIENITITSPSDSNPVNNTSTNKNSQNCSFEVTVSVANKSDKKVARKRKSRNKISSNSDSKVYKTRKSTRISRTSSFPDPTAQNFKGDKLKVVNNSSPKKCKSVADELNKENVIVPSSADKISENNMKTPETNSQIPETWVSGRKFLDSLTTNEEEVFSKRESIAMILKNNSGHVQAKVSLYDHRIKDTPTSIKSTPNDVFRHPGYSYTQSTASQKKRSSSMKNNNLSNRKTDNPTLRYGTRNSPLPPPPKFIIPDLNTSSPKVSYPLKELTNISNSDDVSFNFSPLKNSFNSSINDKTPLDTKNKSSCNIKPKRNSYSGHTPYKLSRVLRSESSPLLPKIGDKSFEKSCGSLSRSPSLVQDFKPPSNSSLFKAKSYLNS